jgi:lysophospholipid acyltransferase (LPLAT)-like uncharacterized protein
MIRIPAEARANRLPGNPVGLERLQPALLKTDSHRWGRNFAADEFAQERAWRSRRGYRSATCVSSANLEWEQSMKLRHPLLIRLMASLAAPLLRSWVGTVTYRFSPECRWVHPESEHVTGRFIYAIWHEALLVPAGVKSPRPVVALISRHADGELIAQVCRWFGVRAVRGSSRRGGAAALRELIEEHARSHILVTPDGPRGPRRCVQPGAVYLASCTGLPIVPVGVGFSRAWRAPSWDRLALPWPGSTVYVVVHPPVSVPGQLNREGLTPYCQQLQQAMDQATLRAERWAQTGRLPASGECVAAQHSSPVSPAQAA